jgi:hypothetical protein
MAASTPGTEPSPPAYLRAALSSSWRSLSLLFWVGVTLGLAVLGVTAVALGSDRYTETAPPAATSITAASATLRTQALAVAAASTAGHDVTAAALAVAEAADAWPEAASLAVAARSLADGSGDARSLALAADRLWDETNPTRRVRSPGP